MDGERAPPSLRASARPAFWLAAAAVLVCALVMSLFPSQSDDIWMHLAVGRRFFREGHFPDPDPWIFSIPDYRRGWLDVWGAHLGAYGLFRLGGFPALVIAKSLLVLSGAAAPFWLARRLSLLSFAVPVLTLLGLWAGCPRFLERASLVSDVCGAWVIAILAAELARSQQREDAKGAKNEKSSMISLAFRRLGGSFSGLRWVLPCVFAVWTNLHPGVLVGLAFVGFAAVSEPRQVRVWGPLWLACVAAACLHPSGYHTLEWAIRGVLGSGFEVYRQFVAEFRPTLGPDKRGTYPVILLLILGALVLAALLTSMRRGTMRVFGVLTFGTLIYLGLSSVRFVTTAAMALPVLAVAVLADARAHALAAPSPTAERASVIGSVLAAGAALALTLTVAVVGYDAPPFTDRKLGLGRDASIDPTAAADVIRGLPLSGHIFNEHGFGAYLAWLWDGDPRIFFHGYVIDAAFYRDNYVAAMLSPAGFDRVMNGFDIDAILLAPREGSTTSGLAIYRTLATRADWHLIFWDKVAVVFLRDRPAYASILEERAFRYVDPYRPEALAVGMQRDMPRVRREVARALSAWPDNEGLRRLAADLGVTP